MFVCKYMQQAREEQAMETTSCSSQGLCRSLFGHGIFLVQLAKCRA